MRQVHGRTQHQRYTKTADWEYINKCVEAGRDVVYDAEGNEAPALPVRMLLCPCVRVNEGLRCDTCFWRLVLLCTQVIGNGDVMSSQEFYDHINTHGVATCMIGRGALIKVRSRCALCFCNVRSPSLPWFWFPAALAVH